MQEQGANCRGEMAASLLNYEDDTVLPVGPLIDSSFIFVVHNDDAFVDDGFTIKYTSAL